MDAAIHVFVTHSVTGWLIVAAVCLMLELATMSGWLLWPSASAAVIALVGYLWIKDVAIQSEMFAALTIVNTVLGQRLIRSDSRTSHNPNEAARRVVGLIGRASANFRDGAGRVFVDGKEWAAELEEEAEVHKGDRVIVVRVLDGARLKVRAKGE